MKPPYYTVVKLTGYQIMSNADHIGGNVFVTVDCRDGRVEGGGPTPR